MDWLYYLVKNGVRASLPIQTCNHELMVVFYDEDKWYIATAFHEATGRF